MHVCWAGGVVGQQPDKYLISTGGDNAFAFACVAKTVDIGEKIGAWMTMPSGVHLCIAGGSALIDLIQVILSWSKLPHGWKHSYCCSSTRCGQFALVAANLSMPVCWASWAIDWDECFIWAGTTHLHLLVSQNGSVNDHAIWRTFCMMVQEHQNAALSLVEKKPFKTHTRCCVRPEVGSSNLAMGILGSKLWISLQKPIFFFFFFWGGGLQHNAQAPKIIGYWSHIFDIRWHTATPLWNWD